MAKFFSWVSSPKAVKETPVVVHTLNNAGIVKLLSTKHNLNLKSVFRLHKIMEKMGIIEKVGNEWLLTEMGRVKYTGWKSRVFNPDLWHSEIVDAIANYIKKNHIDISSINRKW